MKGLFIPRIMVDHQEKVHSSSFFYANSLLQTTHLYPEVIKSFESNQVEAVSKTFNARTEFLAAIEHSREPGKREKTVLVWN